MTMGVTEATGDVAVSGAPECLGHSQSVAVLYSASQQIMESALNSTSVMLCLIFMRALELWVAGPRPVRIAGDRLVSLD